MSACAKTASLDSSFQETEAAAANGHSSSCPETKVCPTALSACHNVIFCHMALTCIDNSRLHSLLTHHLHSVRFILLPPASALQL